MITEAARADMVGGVAREAWVVMGVEECSGCGRLVAGGSLVCASCRSLAKGGQSIESG